MIKKIAIQGIKGSFHDQVVREYYTGSNELVECLSFDALAQAVAKGACDQAGGYRKLNRRIHTTQLCPPGSIRIGHLRRALSQHPTQFDGTSRSKN